MKGELSWKGAGPQRVGDQPHPKLQEAPVCLCLLVFRFCLQQLNVSVIRLSGCCLTLKCRVCHFKAQWLMFVPTCFHILFNSFKFMADQSRRASTEKLFSLVIVQQGL